MPTQTRYWTRQQGFSKSHLRRMSSRTPFVKFSGPDRTSRGTAFPSCSAFASQNLSRPDASEFLTKTRAWSSRSRSRSCFDLGRLRIAALVLLFIFAPPGVDDHLATRTEEYFGSHQCISDSRIELLRFEQPVDQPKH